MCVEVLCWIDDVWFCCACDPSGDLEAHGVMRTYGRSLLDGGPCYEQKT